MSPDGMLVESPARLLPGRQVELVLINGTTREHAPWLVVHSRVGCIRGRSDLRYRAGLRRAQGNNYPSRTERRGDGYQLPAQGQTGAALQEGNHGHPRRTIDGTMFETPERL
jgi:hypothetical protein